MQTNPNAIAEALFKDSPLPGDETKRLFMNAWNASMRDLCNKDPSWVKALADKGMSPKTAWPVTEVANG